MRNASNEIRPESFIIEVDERDGGVLVVFITRFNGRIIFVFDDNGPHRLGGD